MNAARHDNYLTNRMNRLLKWPLLCGWLSLISAPMAWATIPLYQNLSPEYYSPANPPPNLDVAAFDNESIFSINFDALNTSTEFYQTLNTVNYTNNGSMLIDTGFYFDTMTDNVMPDQIAGTFYNPGSIVCGSSDVILDGELFYFENAGKFIAWATNIINPGSIDVGADGLMQFSGQNVDLSRSVLSIESYDSLFTNVLNFSDTANVVGLVGAVGNDTNNDWNPAAALTAGTAYSSEPFQYFLELTNSTSYFEFEETATNDIIIRAVFVQNTSDNVPYNVYFGGYPRLGTGDATVAWAGGYVIPSTGGMATNYLYLNNDYVLGASTNAGVYGGIPNNFTFTGSTVPLIAAPPAPAGFQPVFVSGVITNPYSYLSAELVATTVSTNILLHTNVSALPARIQITGSNEVNLALASISGANYLSVTAPNQFDGSLGAQISAAYADLNLGVTNGVLTVSNLLESTIPIWNGTLQAWSTRWLYVDANGITNDYRVMLVASQLTPLSQPQVQNLTLNVTNSVTISDQLNVYGALSINAQDLTLTTNGYGNGAGSADGELDISTPGFSWSTSLPDLLNLTNNGAIRIFNTYQTFVGTTNVVTVIPTTPAATATGTLSEISSLGNVKANDTVTLGTNVYAFAGKITNTVVNQVLIAPTFNGSLSNLIAAINQGAGAGTSYSSATKVNPLAIAGTVASHAFLATAIETGSVGNSIVTATTSTNLTWSSGATLAGGVNYVAGGTNSTASTVPYDNFINNGLLSVQGSSIWADNFVSSGTISNGASSFTLESLDTTLTNGLLYAGSDISITADSLEASNLAMAGRSLTLRVTNLLTDFVPGGAGVVTNGNIWLVNGSASVGLNLPVKPAVGDLLGTTITNLAPYNRNVINTWGGQDFGVSPAGYSNNAAIGRLILDAATNGKFTFNGAGTSNAIYVDYLELRDQATNRDTHGDPIALTNSSNLVIYYAQAMMEGVSVAELLNHENNNHLRWVAAYAGHFSSTNLYYAGTTNVINAALAQSPDIDSSGTGIPNADNPEPVFVSGQVDFGVTVTNVPPLQARLVWHTIPGATNFVQYATSLPPVWLDLTNSFVTPPAPPYAPITNVFYDPITNTAVQKFYRVVIDPNVIDLYGP